MNRSMPAALAAILLALGHTGCPQATGQAGTSHETETGNQIAGILQSEDGIPASALTVHLRSATFARPNLALGKRAVDGELMDSVLTDAMGHFLFRLGQNDTGLLVLEALGDASSGIRVDIAQTLPKPTDLGIRKLSPTGTLRGEIALPPGESGDILIQLLGTDRHVFLDSGTQTYSIPNLPAGDYTGRAVGFRPPRMAATFQVAVPSAGIGSAPVLNLEKASGAVRGRVLMPPGTRGTAMVEVVGTDLRTQADSAGRFYLSGLAQGEQRLRAFGLIPQRDTVQRTISIRTGEVTGDADLRLTRLSILIVDGANNHDWARLTRAYRFILEKTGRFGVEVSTTPPPGSDSSLWSRWNPAFRNHDAVFLNYSDYGQTAKGTWPARNREALRTYVAEGGGLVVTQTSQSSFMGWDAYRDMIGLGWGNEGRYPGYYLDDAEAAVTVPAGQDTSFTLGRNFLIQALDSPHPILRGIPAAWKHPYDVVDMGLRGPARNMTVLHYLVHPVSGRREPVDWTVAYGRGRVYNTSLGDVVVAGPDIAVRCAGFQTLLGRGAEWAASGTVTYPLPLDFPTAASESVRADPPAF